MSKEDYNSWSFCAIPYKIRVPSTGHFEDKLPEFTSFNLGKHHESWLDQLTLPYSLFIRYIIRSRRMEMIISTKQSY